MSEYNFALIVTSVQLSHDQILDATDTLGEAGCLDASIRAHAEGMELMFHRESPSLQTAIASAIADVEKAGFVVARIELQREAIPA